MSRPEVALLSVHLLATVYMTGLIWFVQLVHYPLFAAVGDDNFVAYQRRHMARSTWAVGPAMLIEVLTAIWLFLDPVAHRTPPALGVGLVGVAWISTWCLQVPLHRKLLHGFDHAAAVKLVRTNWVRTFAWSARSFIAVWMLVEAGTP